MKRINLIFIFFILFLPFLFNNCNKGENNKKSELKNIIASDKNLTNYESTGKFIKKFPPSTLDPNRVIIKFFRLIPDNPTTKDNIEADIKVETQDVEGIRFYYIFYKNNKIINEGESNILSSEYYKKNDVIYCDAVILKDGKEIKRVRSNYVQVLDLPPEIIEIRYPKTLNKPNPYKIYIKAEDPDKDELKFSLEKIEPKVNAIINKISPAEAEILLTLSKEDFDKTISLNIKVEDNENSYITQELKFNLKSKTVKVGEKKGANKKAESLKKKKEIKRGEGIPIRKIGF